MFLFRERKRENQAQLDKVRSLYRQADLMSQAALSYHEICPLCPGQLMMNTRRQLHLHLHSRDHHEKEVMGYQDNSSTTTASTYQK